MEKNIVLFLDGTGNHGYVDSPANTNVYKLWAALKQDDAQITRYIRGIGTHDDPEAGPPTARLLFEQAVGKGAVARVQQAYEFIAENFDEKTHDKVFLFGFSRGAYIARVLAHFIHEVGVLYNTPVLRLQMQAAFVAFWAGEDLSSLRRAVRDLRQQHQVTGPETIPTHFLGQWDTVAAINDRLGSEKELRRFVGKDYNLPLPQWIRNARHALALHEMRSDFAPMLWKTHGPGQTLKQLWFAGAHADVGGGYAPDESPSVQLAAFPLKWMAEEAECCGLKVEYFDEPDHTGECAPHDSSSDSIFRFFTPAIREQVRAGDIQLHPSVIDRLWYRPDLAYARTGGPRVDLWNDIDSAVMTACYDAQYPGEAPADLSPQTLEDALSALSKSFSGQAPLSDEQFAAALQLLRVFMSSAIINYFDGMPSSSQWRLQFRTASSTLNSGPPRPTTVLLDGDADIQNTLHSYFVLSNIIPPGNRTRRFKL